MRFIPAHDDAEGFLCILNGVLTGVIESTAPPAIIVLKVDNWFGFKWLAFAGKVLGALGRWNDTHVVPPFVPGRIVSQRRFESPCYVEVESGKPIHLNIPSDAARTRSISEAAGGAALVWYSGNSLQNQRGCIMAYVPGANGYNGWYASWVQNVEWTIAETRDIAPAALLGYLATSGTAASPA